MHVLTRERRIRIHSTNGAHMGSKLIECGQGWPIPAQVWPPPEQALVDFGPNLAACGPTWVQLGPMLAGLGPTWVEWGKHVVDVGPTLVETGPNLVDAGRSRVNVGRVRTNLSRNRPTIEFEPSVGRLCAGLCCSTFGRICVAKIQPSSNNMNPILATAFAQIRAIPAKVGLVWGSRPSFCNGPRSATRVERLSD